VTISGIEDITPPALPRLVRWTCQEPGCTSWAEGDEAVVTYMAEQHALVTHGAEEAAPEESAPDVAE
jgi:hypothetical protein